MTALFAFWKMQGGHCFYCGQDTYLPHEPKLERYRRLGIENIPRSEARKRQASLEHIQRRVDGGIANFDNLIMVCVGCNSSRGEKAPLLHLSDMRSNHVG